MFWDAKQTASDGWFTRSSSVIKPNSIDSSYCLMRSTPNSAPRSRVFMRVVTHAFVGIEAGDSLRGRQYQMSKRWVFAWFMWSSNDSTQQHKSEELGECHHEVNKCAGRIRAANRPRLSTKLNGDEWSNEIDQMQQFPASESWPQNNSMTPRLIVVLNYVLLWTFSSYDEILSIVGTVTIAFPSWPLICTNILFVDRYWIQHQH